MHLLRAHPTAQPINQIPEDPGYGGSAISCSHAPNISQPLGKKGCQLVSLQSQFDQGSKAKAERHPFFSRDHKRSLKQECDPTNRAPDAEWIQQTTSVRRLSVTVTYMTVFQLYSFDRTITLALVE